MSTTALDMRRPRRHAATSNVTARSWRDHRVCTEADFDLFMSDAPADHAYARTICAPCPARQFCLQFALDNKADFGVFGGLGPNERMQMRGCRPRYASTSQATLDTASEAVAS
jgi:WhiB family redox-sensing transcriptional regulator